MSASARVSPFLFALGFSAALLLHAPACGEGASGEAHSDDADDASEGSARDASRANPDRTRVDGGSSSGGERFDDAAEAASTGDPEPRADGGRSSDAGAGDARSDAGASTAAPDAARPPTNFPLGAQAMFPAPSATIRCTDPPLRVEFAAPPTLGTRGRVQVFRDDDPRTPVATVDLGAGVQRVTRGAQTIAQAPAAHVDGNAALFALSPGALARGGHYHVMIDDGVLRSASGSFAIRDAATWRFTVAEQTTPIPGELSVGQDDASPYCTVQAALDAAPRAQATIVIGAGSYFGPVYATGKNKLTIRGRDRARTKIVGVNNNNLNPSTRTRSLVSLESSSELLIENLTIHNLTPQGGSQAEALALFGCDRCIVREANILSLQDTLLWNGRVYAENCFIAGNVDFIWGSGAALFKSCEIKTVGRGGYIVQARNGASGYGYVFVDSKITSDPGVTSTVFARIDASEYPASHVAVIDCEVGAHITAAGFTATNASGRGALRFWEYGSKDSAGRPIATAGRSPYSRQLSASEAAMMRDPAVVLGFNPSP